MKDLLRFNVLKLCVFPRQCLPFLFTYLLAFHSFSLIFWSLYFLFFFFCQFLDTYPCISFKFHNFSILFLLDSIRLLLSCAGRYLHICLSEEKNTWLKVYQTRISITSDKGKTEPCPCPKGR